MTQRKPRITVPFINSFLQHDYDLGDGGLLMLGQKETTEV